MSNFYMHRWCRSFLFFALSALWALNAQGQINQNPGLNLVGDITSWNPNPPAPGSPLLSAYDPVNSGGGVILLTTGSAPGGSPGVRRWRASYQSAKPTGTYAFIYATYVWSDKWASVNVVMNTLQSYTKQGGSDNQLPTVNGKWYTTNWEDKGWVNTNAVWMETTNSPVSITNSAQSPVAGSVTPTDPVDVTVTTSGSLSPEEKVYVRWSTNNFGTSNLTLVTMVGNTGTITIPAQLDGTTIQYHALTSTGTAVQIGSNYDMFSLSMGAPQTYNSTALPPVNITFQVDMASRGIETAGVHIAGSFNGTNYAATPLTLVSGTVYETTISLSQGATVQYKYSAADAGWAAETVPGGCDNGSGFREYTVGNSDATVPLHCFGYCTACPPSIPVTFRVNMTGLTVSGNGVHVAGEFGAPNTVWNPGGITLSPVGGGMYETTINVIQGKTIAYKFINGDSWGSEEGVPGACAFSGNRNATIAVAPSYIIPANCFGTCSNCVSVTFNVDMNGLSISGNGVHVAGFFQGWNPSNTSLSHIGGGIYSTTVNVDANTSSDYKFVNGNAWGTDESAPNVCGSSGNRNFAVGTTNKVIPAVCFNRCISCSATSNWTGNGDGNFNNGNNWTAGVPPNGCAFNIQINPAGNQPTIGSGTFTSGNVSLKPGATLAISSGATLSICGDFTGGGTVTGAGKVELTGTPAQNVTGVTTFSNLTLTKPSTTTITGTAKIKGLLTLSNSTSNVVIPGGGKLVLVSDASSTASIAAIPAGATITGNVTQQRYLTGTGNGWFLLGTPITAGDFSQWSDNMYMCAGSNLGGNQGVISLGIQHSTIFKMDEPNAAVYVDTVQKYGWRAPVLGDLLSPGKGFRVWLKAYNTPSRTIDNVGTVNQGDFTFPNITRTEVANCQPNGTPSTIIPCTESFRGWNLLANPYPSSVDWDAVSPAWTKPAAMSNAWYRWHSAFGGYGVYPAGGPYSGTTPAPANPNLIPSGQAYFVKVNTAGSYSLSIKETAKSNTGGQFLRVNVNQDLIRVNLSQSTDPADYGYDAVIRFMADATDGFDAAYDFENLAANNFNLSVPVGTVGMSIASYAPISGSKVVPLTTYYAGVYGNYFLKFTEIENMLATNTIYLMDNVLGSLEAVTPGYTYSYVANANDALISNRFELVFSNESVTGNSLALAGVHFGLHPNPVTGKSVNVTLSGMKDVVGQVSIVDILGKQVYASKLNIKKEGLTEKSLDINLASGLYTVKLITKSQTFTQKLIVR